MIHVKTVTALIFSIFIIPSARPMILNVKPSGSSEAGHPLTMPFNELSEAIGGSGKAKLIWSDLRNGVDPLDPSTSSISARAQSTLKAIDNDNGEDSSCDVRSVKLSMYRYLF